MPQLIKKKSILGIPSFLPNDAPNQPAAGTPALERRWSPARSSPQSLSVHQEISGHLNLIEYLEHVAAQEDRWHLQRILSSLFHGVQGGIGFFHRWLSVKLFRRIHPIQKRQRVSWGWLAFFSLIDGIIKP